MTCDYLSLKELLYLIELVIPLANSLSPNTAWLNITDHTSWCRICLKVVFLMEHFFFLNARLLDLKLSDTSMSADTHCVSTADIQIKVTFMSVLFTCLIFYFLLQYKVLLIGHGHLGRISDPFSSQCVIHTPKFYFTDCICYLFQCLCLMIWPLLYWGYCINLFAYLTVFAIKVVGF